MTTEFVILGASGQVGRTWSTLLGDRAIGFSRPEIDLADPGFIDKLESKLGDKPIRAVINCAAYTGVDKAESEEKLATRVNVDAVRALAKWCKTRDIALVHYSTDYVFGGKGSVPNKEVTATVPMNVYGKSKLAGEEAIAEVGGKSLIFRTSWVFDAEGVSFFNTMLKLFTEKEEIFVVSDQVGAPTYAPHVVEASFSALTQALEAKSFPSGIYHLCGSGETSRHGFATAIFALATKHISGIRCVRINPVLTADTPTPAKRPLNSRLDCAKVNRVFGVALPTWEEGLRECIEKKYGNSELQHRGTQAHTS